MATHSNILAGESHAQRSLAGYSPWGGKELDLTEVTEHACMHGSIVGGFCLFLHNTGLVFGKLIRFI